MATWSNDVEEREFLVWLRGVEKRTILPLKWAIFAVAVTFWALSHPRYWPPPVDVFSVFTFYLMYNIGQSYFFYLSRVSLSQVRIFCVLSYCVDIAFVTALIFFDSVRYPSTAGPATDFHLMFFLLILRGFALFRRPQANLIANVVVGALFIVSLAWQDTSLATYSSRNSFIRIVFIFLLILMSWSIVEVISRQKDELMRAREHLIRSENLAILGELAAGVAHEINNPIGVISACAEYLQRNAAPDDPRSEDFASIFREAQRCERIVAELLDYARPAVHVKTPTDLRALNNDVLDFLFRRADAREVKLVRDYQENLPEVFLDANHFKQALLNVYLNARQAMSGRDGVLRVTIRADLERNGLRQRVEDNGCGIDASELKRVFDPFFTMRPGGTGLGLSITKRVVETHGGEIRIESRKGSGTVVEIFLPIEHSITE